MDNKYMKKETILKWSIVLGFGYYLYHKADKGQKESSLLGFEAADSEKVMDSVVPWLKVNPTVKPFIHSMGKRFLENVIEKHSDTIEAEYKNVN